MEQGRLDVYVSYAPPDRVWAQRLSSELTESGLRVFVDYAMVSGEDFSSVIDDAINNSRHQVVLWSHHAVRTKRVSDELSRFESRRGRHGNAPRITLITLDDQPYDGPEADFVFDVHGTNAYPGEPEKMEPALWHRLAERVGQEIEGPQRVQTSMPAGEAATKSAPSISARTAADDYAVVIGVSSYPRLGDLPSASADARAFAEWLTDPAGGALAPGRVRVVTTDDASTTPRTLAGILAAFEPLVERAADHVGQRIGRRLYIFASGRGSSRALGELTLAVPDADPPVVRGLDLRRFADFFKALGAFDEVVLFADCLPVKASVSPITPDWKLAPALGRIATASFYASARRIGENQRPGSTNTGLGAFTQALLEGLRSGHDGVVASDILSQQLRTRLGELTYGGQKPEFSSDGPPIQFGPAASTSRAAQPTVTSGPTEHVAAHADNPALVDELGRRPFAEILAARIEEVHRSSAQAGAFMVNLHGPWGAGKTSVMNFLKANLQDEEKRAPKDLWVVVEFNAWRHQRLQPPWWSLIKAIQAQAVEQLEKSPDRAARLRRRWLWWRFRADWLPSIFSVTFILAALLIMTVTLVRQGASMAGDAGVGKAIELGLGLVSAFVAAGAAIVTLSRSLLFGSATAAQSYMDARSDPFGPIITLFEHLVKEIERPLAVFIDDLDRCDSEYVIALLEGIQTLLRTRRVTYVVAGDRKWICTCFENKYQEFAKTIGEPGRPLGYLFLDKVFQVSAAVPRLSPMVQRNYWQALLKSGTGAEPSVVETERKVAEGRAQEQLRGVRTKEEFDRKIEQAAATGDARVEQAMRAAVAKQITSPDVLKETEHRLRAFADLLEPNPRAMKRLVNAYGMYQAAHVLERRTVSPEALARWTIVELRWPLLAECIAGRPDLLNARDAAADDAVPKKYARLLKDATVKAVLSGGADGRGVLTEESLREIVGDVGESGSSGFSGNAFPTPAELA